MDTSNTEISAGKISETQSLAQEFQECRKVLQALGDENRQHLLLVMMTMGKPEGARVGAIAAQTALSRPAVSHHIQILKEAGILNVRKEGTRNYYHFNSKLESIGQLIHMLQHAQAHMRSRAELVCEQTNEEA